MTTIGDNFEDRPPVEPFVPTIEVKNRCQPDFTDCIGKVKILAVEAY